MRTLCLCSLLAVCVCTVTTLLVITCIGSMHVDQLDPRRGAPKRQICPHCDTIVALRKASFATERNKRSRQHNKHPNKVFERWAASRSEELMRVTERLYSTEAERQRVSSPGVHEPACVGRLCAPYKTQAKSAERSCPPTALTGGLPAGEIAVPVPPRYFSPDLKLESHAPPMRQNPAPMQIELRAQRTDLSLQPLRKPSKSWSGMQLLARLPSAPCSEGIPSCR